MSSARLPGKVLLPLHGKPVLQWVVDAARESKLIDEVVVATSNVSSDVKIKDYCYANGIMWTAGHLNDVLSRFYDTALLYRPVHIVRLPADCPYRVPQIIDDTIKFHLRGDYDYTTNFINRGFDTAEIGDPMGMRMNEGYNVEVFKYGTLLRACKLAETPYDREHVTPWMQRLDNIGLFTDYLPPDMKLSIDTIDDYERLKLHFPA